MDLDRWGINSRLRATRSAVLGFPLETGGYAIFSGGILLCTLSITEKESSHAICCRSVHYRGVGNPVVWQAPDGLVWLFWVARYGDTWSESRIMARVSKDGAQSWNTDTFPVAYELGMMVRCKPLDLGGGEFLLPVYHETGHDREIVGADTISLLLALRPHPERVHRNQPDCV